MPLSQTMPSLAYDVSEDVLAAASSPALTLMTVAQGDPYVIAHHSSSSSSDRSNSSRQLTLHQVLARAQTPRLSRSTARMSVRPP